jgi:hypothetical protein
MTKVFKCGRIVLMGIVVTGLAAPTAALAQRVRDGRNRSSASDRSDDDRGPKETEQVDRTVALPSNGTLRLKNFSGNVHIVAADSNRNIVVKATRRATRDRLDHIKLDISTSGSTVTIDANKRDEQWARTNHNNNVVDTVFELQVPASANLDIDGFSSDVIIDGITGEQHLKTFSGDIEVRNPQGAVDAETFSADIRVTVSHDAKGSVSFDTFSGDLDTTLPISTTSWRKRSVEGTLPGGAGPRMKFHTFSGDLKISSR